MKIRIFISSVQKELADERLALQILISTDPFLARHCVPVLFERQPATLRPKPTPYLELLKSCQVYVAVLWKEYGAITAGKSATHREYELAQKLGMPTLITIRGPAGLERDPGTNALIDEIRSAGHTYDRFETTEELQKHVRSRLIRHIQDIYHVEPTTDQNQVARHTIQVASAFERQRIDRLAWEELDHGIATEVVQSAQESTDKRIGLNDVRHGLWQRGYLWRDESDRYFATAAGALLFGSDPSILFPHCRLELAAHTGAERTSNPSDHQTVRKPLTRAIDESVSFIQRNTRHPLRVVGLKRINVSEYPEEALREAIVNALAHRDYEDAGRKISIDVFLDRIEIVSPGPLPGNLSLKMLQSGKARARSRNPNIAQGLVLLGRMEERGTGIQRMRDAMLDHGLDLPVIRVVEDEVVVTLPGPGENLDRIRIPDGEVITLEPSVEAKLNERQKEIVREVVRNGSVTTGWCKEQFGVVQDTAVRDLRELVEWKVLEVRGKGRGTHYVLAQS